MRGVADTRHGRTGRAVRAAVIAACALAAAVPASAPAATTAQTRYTLANGCWALSAGGQPIAGAERLRLQATTLGSYLLYRPDRTVLSAQDDTTVAAQAEPSAAADWRVEDSGSGTFLLTPASAPGRALAAGQGGAPTLVARSGAGPQAAIAFAPADGCAVYPEADLSATGTPSKGATPYGRVGGFVEGHMHWMTYEYLGGNFHCGRPWHAYGVPSALPDCSSVEGPQGLAAPVQNFLNFGSPVSPHDTSGWPKLTEWGAHNLTYEGTYWRWIQRSWMAGLRLMVMSVNENRVLCELMPTRIHSCDEMSTVRQGFKDIRDLQDYVDAQAGGPGKGFFQIVTTPQEARRVINEGRMAVVLEIEVSELFGCRGWQTSTCDRAQVDRELDEMYRLGVRSSLLLNKFDNPLTGVRFDGGPIGVLINAANRSSAGSFWSAQTCTSPLHDNTIETGVPEGSAVLDTALTALGVNRGTLPAYPPAPHCNTRGLTTLGRHVVRRMMDLGMIVNPDHMSQAAVDDTLTLLESRRYSGVISPHGWMDPGNWPRLWKLGGMAFPGHSRASDYVKEWQKYRPERTPYAFGWGYGADLGGLSGQPDTPEGGGITYPFRSYDGKVTFDRQRSGERTFDYDKEGVAHYGLYADWFADLQRLGGEALMRDMWNGAEAYLEMWERAEGIRAPGCNPSRAAVTRHALGTLRLGTNWEGLLRRAGQPQQRTRAWSWCVKGAGNRRAADVAVLSKAGRVELVGSTARGRSAGGIAVGARLRGGALQIRRSGGATYVYVVRGGRVRAVAAVVPALGRDRARLRKAAALLRAARASSAPRTFTPGAAGAAGPTGAVLAGSSDPRLNSALALLCSLQIQR